MILTNIKFTFEKYTVGHIQDTRMGFQRKLESVKTTLLNDLV